MISDDGNDVLLAAERSLFVVYQNNPAEPLLRIFHRKGRVTNIRVGDLPETCELLTGHTEEWGVPLLMFEDGHTLEVRACAGGHYGLDLKTGIFNRLESR
jgi:hypothetical protein